jgi:hypothetical protein
MHLVCCQKFVFGLHSLLPLVSPDPTKHLVVCTKRCYTNVAKTLPSAPSTEDLPLTVPAHVAALAASTGTPHVAGLGQVPANTRLAWNKDGKNGPNDPNHSEFILLAWLTTHGNYERFRGTGNNGVRKINFANTIASTINNAGVRKVRTGKDVLNKIEYIEKSFRLAHDWSHTETGEGLRETDKGSYEEALLKKCPWYFDLVDIFQDRANARPHYTTDNMFGDTDSDDDFRHDTEDKGDDDALKSSGKAGTDKVGAEASFKANDDNDNDDDSTDDEEPIEVVGVVCSGSNKENEVGHATGVAATNKMKGAGEEKKDEPKKGNNKMEASDEAKKRPSTIPLSVKKKKNKAATNKKKGKGELDDPFTVEVVKCFALNSEKKEATELIRSKELNRHNKAMEDLATRDQDWKERQSDFDFKVKRLTQYHELKAKFDVDFIRSVFPEMKDFIDAETLLCKG